MYSYLRYYREVSVNIGEARDLHQQEGVEKLAVQST